MFIVKEKGIILNGYPWASWLTLTLTPSMLDALAAELNVAMTEAENSGWEDGHSDGLDEGWSDGYEIGKEEKEKE